jgi:transcriptional regulator with XRE-family HTH domain
MPTTHTSHPTDRHVGARVRALRRAKNLSQSELGDILGVTFQQVQKYEKGANRIAPSRLQVIAEKLETPITFFFDRPGQSVSDGYAHAVDEFLGSLDGAQIVRAWGKLKPSLRRQLAIIARNMAT